MGLINQLITGGAHIQVNTERQVLVNAVVFMD